MEIFVFSALISLFFLIQGIATAVEKSNLMKKFASLGDMTGKTEAEITAVVGQPTSRSAMVDGQLLQWMATGYHISIMFDANGVFAGVQHEATV